MTWRYQAYRYEDGSVGIHERYELSGGVVMPTEQPILVLDVEPQDGEACELEQAEQSLYRTMESMMQDLAAHGIEDWTFLDKEQPNDE